MKKTHNKRANMMFQHKHPDIIYKDNSYDSTAYCSKIYKVFRSLQTIRLQSTVYVTLDVLL